MREGYASPVVHAPARAVPLEPVADVDLLLEVEPQREVEEGPAAGGELHRRAQSALHDSDVARGMVQVEVGQEAVHLDTRRHVERSGVDPWSGDHDHPQVGDPASRLVVRRSHAFQQVGADPGAADADETDHVLLGVTEACAQGRPLHRIGAFAHHVAGELEVLFGPLAHVRQVRTQGQVNQSAGSPTNTDRSRSEGNLATCSTISAL